MIDIVMLPLARDAVAEMINDNVAVAELMGWSTPATLRDELPLLIRDRILGDYPQLAEDLVFPVPMSHTDFIRIRVLGHGVSVAVKNRVYGALMRSIIAYTDGCDDADVFRTGSRPVS